MSASVGFAYILFLGMIPIGGMLLIAIAEFLLLKKKDWVDQKHSVLFPLVSNFVVVVIGVVLVFANVFVSIFTVHLIVNLLSSFAGNAGITPATFIIAFFLNGFILFFLDLIVIFPVRFLIMKIILKSSALTWKYALVFSALSAAVFAIGYPLYGIFSALTVHAMAH